MNAPPIPSELVQAPLVQGLDQPLPSAKMVMQRRLIALSRSPQDGPRGHRPKAFLGKERFRRIEESIARPGRRAAPRRWALHGKDPH